MTNLTPVSSLDDVVQHPTSELLLAGPGGPLNQQAQSLLNRTEYLKDQNSSRVSEIASLQAFDVTVDTRFDQIEKTILDYGTITGVNDSAAAIAMIADVNRLVIPSGVTAAVKNVELFNNTEVINKGILKLPDNCIDFDRMLHAAGKSGIVIKSKEIDGNAAGQSGSIGTHLVYLTNCPDAIVELSNWHDHYYSASATAPSVDGIRDTSTGGVFLYQCSNALVTIGLYDSWGREGVQLRDCTDSTLKIGHGQGGATGREYSGVQVSGRNNKLVRCSIDGAGASGVGFDTIDGVISNIISTNSRANHGINFGHPGFPSHGTVASNLVVDGAFRHGISVSAGTADLSISGFLVKNAGELGLNVSDSSLRAKFSNGSVETSAQYNVSVLDTTLSLYNSRFSLLDELSVRVDSAIGSFAVGETVTSSGSTAVIRYVQPNLNGSQQILFLNSVVGTFTAPNSITGGTSAASGTIGLVSTPIAKRELGSGVVLEDGVNTSTGGLGTTVKFADGTMIHRNTVAVAATAATLASVATNYPATATWVTAPQVTTSISNVSSTDTFDIDRQSCSRTTTNYTIKLKATVTQTYSIDVISVGRWK